MRDIRPAPGEPSGDACGDLRGVLFDMDGLLVDSEPFWFEVESSVMERLGGTWSEADQQALVGGSLQRTLDYLLARATRQVGRDTVAGWMVGGMVELIGSRQLPVMPGALALIAEVAAAGVPYALVTSSERPVMDAVLNRLEVTFPVTVCGDDVSNTKPDPEPYLLAAAKLGADPRQCIAVEDSPNGAASAEAAGCLLVAVPSLVPIPPADGRLVLTALTELSLARLHALAASR